MPTKLQRGDIAADIPTRYIPVPDEDEKFFIEVDKILAHRPRSKGLQMFTIFKRAGQPNGMKIC